MQYGLTENVQKRARQDGLPAGDEKNMLFCWEAELAETGGSTVLLLINTATSYTVVVKLDEDDTLRGLRLTLDDTIRDILGRNGIPEMFVNIFFEFVGDSELTGVHGGSGQYVIDRVKGILEGLDLPLADGQYQEEISEAINIVRGTTPTFPEFAEFEPKEMFIAQVRSLVASDEIALKNAVLTNGDLVINGRIVKNDGRQGTVISLEAFMN